VVRRCVVEAGVCRKTFFPLGNSRRGKTNFRPKTCSTITHIHTYILYVIVYKRACVVCVFASEKTTI